MGEIGSPCRLEVLARAMSERQTSAKLTQCRRVERHRVGPCPCQLVCEQVQRRELHKGR
jgi:hypothetical protein